MIWDARNDGHHAAGTVKNTSMDTSSKFNGHRPQAALWAPDPCTPKGANTKHCIELGGRAFLRAALQNHAKGKSPTSFLLAPRRSCVFTGMLIYEGGLVGSKERIGVDAS